MNPLAHIKTSAAFVLWMLGAAVIGAVLGLRMGLGFGIGAGLVIGFLYAVCGVMACDKLPVDFYEGRLMMREEDSELVEIVEDLAERARIHAPDLYILALDHPNVLAWASSNGHVGFARIGISPDIRMVLNPAEIQAAMAVAIARIASGESALLSRGASLAGLALQAAYSPWTNKTLGFMHRDPDTGLTPLGGALLTLMSPMSRATLLVTDPCGSWLSADMEARKLLGSGASIASMIARLSDAAGQTKSGALRGYNAGLVGLFIVSPLHKLVERATSEAAERMAAQMARASSQLASAKTAASSKIADVKKAAGVADAPSPADRKSLASEQPANAVSPPAPVTAPRQSSLGWSARVAAWIADATPSVETRTKTLAPKTTVSAPHS